MQILHLDLLDLKQNHSQKIKQQRLLISYHLKHYKLFQQLVLVIQVVQQLLLLMMVRLMDLFKELQLVVMVLLLVQQSFLLTQILE